MDQNVSCARCHKVVPLHATLGSSDGPICAACQELDTAVASLANQPESGGNLAAGILGGVFAPFGIFIATMAFPGPRTRTGAMIGVVVAIGIGVVLVASSAFH